MSNWWVEVWEIPGVGTDQIIPHVPATSCTWEKVLNGIGNGSVTVPAFWDDLSEIDGHVLRVYQENTLVYSFFADEKSEPYVEEGQRMVTLSGPGIESMISWPITYPWDYPDNPTTQPDWLYGSSDGAGSFNVDMGTFDVDEISTGWEDQAAGGWTEIHGSHPGFQNNDEDIEISDVDKRTGTYSLLIDFGNGRSGIERKSIPVVPGGRYTIEIYVKSANTGKRITLGASVDPGFTAYHTNRFDFNGYSMCELDNDAEGTGSTDGTWQKLELDIEFFEGDDDTDGQTETTIQLVSEDTWSGPTTYVDDFLFSGVGAGIDPWTNIALYGSSITTFERSSAEAHSGTYSLKWKVSSPTTAKSAGVEVPVSGLTDGQLVSFSVWLKAASATNCTLVIGRANNGGWINHQDVSVTTAWQKFTVTTRLTATDGLINAMVRWDGTGTSPDIYLDDALVFAGLPANSAGKIMQDWLDDAAVDHVAEGAPGEPRTVLAHLKYDSFGSTLDSGSSLWDDDELAVRMPIGMRGNQVLNEVITRWAYEWKIEWNETAGQYEYKQYNPLGMGSTHTLWRIMEGHAIVSGSVERWTPNRNHLFALGDDGNWAEAKNAANQTSYERREQFVGDDRAIAPESITALAEAQIALFSENLGVSLTIKWERLLLPGVQFDVGDTVPVELPSYGVDENYRVRSIRANLQDDDSKSTFTLGFNSEVVEAAAAAEVALVKVLEKFEETRAPVAFAQAAASGLFEGPIEPTVMVAASNARPAIRALADFKCSGSDDDVEILAAINTKDQYGGGRIRVICSEGDFYFGSDLTVPDPVSVFGLSELATRWISTFGDGGQTLTINGEVGRLTLMENDPCSS